MQAARSSSSLHAVPAWLGVARQVAVLAAVALLNPYTLFGLDAGSYWLSAFLMPLMLAATYLGAQGLARRGASWPGASQPGLSFVRLSAMLQVLMLAAQWVDV